MVSFSDHAAPEWLASPVGGSYPEWEGGDGSPLRSPLLLQEEGRAGGARLQSPSLAPETVVKRIVREDGCVAIRATTATPRPNGYRDVRVEHYLIPAPDADAAPGPEHLSRVEYRVLSPWTVAEPPGDDASTVYTAPAVDGASVATYTTSGGSRRRRKSRRGTLLVAGALAFLVFVAGAALARDSNRHRGSDSKPDDSKQGDSKQSDSEKDESKQDVAPAPIDDGSNSTGGVAPEDAEEAMDTSQDSEPDVAPGSLDPDWVEEDSAKSRDSDPAVPEEEESDAIDDDPASVLPLYASYLPSPPSTSFSK